MDLSKEIKLSDLIKKKSGGKNKEFSAGELKTYINFAEISTKEKKNWGMAIPGIIIIAILAALLGKFGVADRFKKADEAEAEVAALQDKLDEDYRILAGMSELSEQFYHYTWTDMTAEEAGRVSRVRVAELLSYIAGRGIAVNQASVKDTQLSVSVTANTLEDISRLTESLKTQEIVASSSVVNAKTNLAEDEETIIDVDAQINISLNTLSEIEQNKEN